MIGMLLYDDVQGRFIVQELIDHEITDGCKTVELHCGTPLSICPSKDKWCDTRIEKNSDDELYGWYFVGLGKAAPYIGHRVKI